MHALPCVRAHPNVDTGESAASKIGIAFRKKAYNKKLNNLKIKYEKKTKISVLFSFGKAHLYHL